MIESNKAEAKGVLVLSVFQMRYTSKMIFKCSTGPSIIKSKLNLHTLGLFTFRSVNLGFLRLVWHGHDSTAYSME